MRCGETIAVDDEIIRLRLGLQKILGKVLEMPDVPSQLPQQIAHLRVWLRGAGSGRPPRDRMREAVAAFRQSGQLASLADARLTCFGAVERFVETQPALIEEGQDFPRLLDEVERFADEPRAYRRCYRGLLHTYFVYDPDSQQETRFGRRNWEKLRDYLEARIRSVRADGSQPEWVPAIEEHRNLLGKDPVSRYGESALQGDSSAFNDARTRLEIDEDSWLVRRLVLAQVRAAVEARDEEFRRHVDPLVSLLQEFPLQRDEGLALLLDRYAEIASHPEQAALRDSSIGAWGNPSLVMNDARWSRVQPATRTMVRNWLNLDLIRQFFSVLAEDRSTDKRRVRFWEKYHTQVDEIYFGLGPNAARSRSADMRHLREKIGSHLLGLVRPGSAANNAFIMKMGDYYVVEFGVSGNACFVFRASRLPFALRGDVSADSSGLKHPEHLHRLLHVDRTFDKWEDEFERTLERLGIKASSTGVPPRARKPALAPRAELRRTESTTTHRPETGLRAARGAPQPFSWVELRRFVTANGLRIEDLTNRGGRLWVMGALQYGPLADTLEEWGFHWAASRGAWYRVE